MAEKSIWDQAGYNGCNICAENLKEPAQLPCRHVFCLHCLQQITKETPDNSIFGQTFPCPLCRREFIIPETGLKSFVIHSESKNICDICTEKSASWKCFDCEQNLCEEDFNVHMRLKVTKDHVVGRIKDLYGHGNYLQRHEINIHCVEHPNKRIELFCKPCSVGICVNCSLENHSNHKPFTTIKHAAEEYYEEIQTYVGKVNKQISDCFNDTLVLEQGKKFLVNSIEVAERQIVKQIDEFKDLLDQFKLEFIEELDAIKSSEVKNLQILAKELETRRLNLESFKESFQVVNETTPSVEIIRLADEYRLKMSNWSDEFAGHKSVLMPTIASSVSFNPSILRSSIFNKSDLIGTVAIHKYPQCKQESSPNQRGRREYSREFLHQLAWHSSSNVKPQLLEEIPEIIRDPSVPRQTYDWETFSSRYFIWQSKKPPYYFGKPLESVAPSETPIETKENN